MNRRELLQYAVATAPLVTVPSLLFANNNKEAESDHLSPDAALKIQRLSWAGIKLVCGDATVFVDAVLDDNETKLVTETGHTYGLITHAHGDHYSPAALRTVFDKKSVLVSHKDVLKWAIETDLLKQPLEMHEPVILTRRDKDIVARPVPAADGFGIPQVSWVIDGGGKKIIHCGDTLWHGHWWDIGRMYGPFDLAFMPINGARQNDGRFTDVGIPCVLTPEQAVIAAKLLGAKAICPMHYGKPDENYFEVPNAEARFLAAAKENNMKTVLLKKGEWLNWQSI